MIQILSAGRKPVSTAAAADAEAAERLIASGNRAEEEGRLPAACEMYRAAIDVAPRYAPAHLNLGIGLEAAGDADGALQSYERALVLDPANPYVNYNLGKLLCSLEDPERAERLLRSALESKPAFAEANVMLANLYDTQGNHRAAAAELEAALEHRPQYVGALCNYATVLRKMGRWNDAESALRRAVNAKPDGNFDALNALGGLLALQGRLAEATGCYEKATELRPEIAEARWNIGNVLADQGRLDEAVIRYQEALSLDPGFIEARRSLCMVLLEQGRPADAIVRLRELLSSNPDFANGHLSLGTILGGQRRLDEAADSLHRALALKPELAEAHVGLGKIHKARDNTAEAIRCYKKSLSIEPENVEARWAVAVSELQAVSGSDAAAAEGRIAFSRKLDELDRWIGEARLASSVKIVGNPPPFYLAYQEQNNRALLQRHGSLCSRIMADWLKGQRPAASTRPRRRRDILRVAVVSAYFQNHSVWNALVKGWFQQMDRARFELDAYYLGDDFDRETRFAQSSATHFEQGNGSLHRWVRAIAIRQPDVLVYPEIGMDPLTLKLASMRLAPAQVTTWGHPETTGLPTIDHFISAEDLEPEQANENYTEQLSLLPHLGCCYPSRRIEPVAPDLSSLGIDSSVSILVCPGTPFKYAPRHDRVFAEIASRLDSCRFVFFTYRVPELSDKLRNRLRAVFASLGLDAEKFIAFIPWQTPAEFRGLMGRAHVFLDTLGFSGFNTAMEAVECGLPIVTREGQFMRGRFASGILRRMGMHELVAKTEEDYVDLAVRICRDAEYRTHLRQRIEAKRSILFDDPAPIRALEDFLARTAR